MQQSLLSGHGGDRIAETLAAHGVLRLYTLCGGHISPILTAAKARGIRVIDVRDEASAVFAGFNFRIDPVRDIDVALSARGVAMEWRDTPI